MKSLFFSPWGIMLTVLLFCSGHLYPAAAAFAAASSRVSEQNELFQRIFNRMLTPVRETLRWEDCVNALEHVISSEGIDKDLCVRFLSEAHERSGKSKIAYFFDELGSKDHKLDVLHLLERNLEPAQQSALALHEATPGVPFINWFLDTTPNSQPDLVTAFVSPVVEELINTPTRRGLTPLMQAAIDGKTNIVEALLVVRATNPTAVDPANGRTALMKAVFSQHKPVVEVFVRVLGTRGDDTLSTIINMQDSKGTTALMIAAKQGFPQIAQLLLEHGADSELRNNDGNTALDLAKGPRVAEMIRLWVRSHGRAAAAGRGRGSR